MEDTAQMRDFIEFYKGLPELWNNKNEHYKNKNIRNRSINKLLVEYQKIKNDCTLEELKKKIANMRSSYRRELRKVTKSQKSGAGADDIYVSNLWYYESLDFLRELEMPLSGRSSLTSDEDEQNGSINMGKNQKKASLDNVRMNFLKKAAEHLESASNRPAVEDEATVYGNGWACMYQQMNPTQQLFAKRAIDEILILGRLNQLTYNTVHSGFNGSAISTPNTTRSTPIFFNDDSMQFLQTVQDSNIRPRGSSTPLVLREPPIQCIQKGELTSVIQAYGNVASRPITDNEAQSYDELFRDSQYR